MKLQKVEIHSIGKWDTHLVMEEALVLHEIYNDLGEMSPTLPKASLGSHSEK